MYYRHFRLRRSWVIFEWVSDFIKSIWGMAIVGLAVAWVWGVEDRYKVSLRQILNEKFLKYIPVENGGQILFPFTFILDLCLREHPQTQWSSFDQKSFFPHSDGFKMQMAIVFNDLELLEELLEKGWDVDILVDPKNKTPALGLAASLGRVHCVESLIRRGADINQTDFEGNTPLMLAVIEDQVEVIKVLVNQGADLNLQDTYGYSAVQKAQNRGLDHISEFLEQFPQKKRTLEVNPITRKLEQFGDLFEDTALKIDDKYNIDFMKTGNIYPFFSNTQGLLIYFFKNFDKKELEIYCADFAYHNVLDDKGTAEQELLSFGDAVSGN